MYGKCICNSGKLDTACGSANCQMERVYEPTDILPHIERVSTGMVCDLPNWWWCKKHFETKDKDKVKFVEDILKVINGTDSTM